MKTSTFAWGALSIAILLLLPRIASAKPTVDHSDPKPGSELDAPPAEIKVWFTDELDPLCRSLRVEDSQGNQIDAEDTHQDPNDPKELVVTIPNRIYNGEYTVIWDITNTNSEQNKGRFTFTVNIKD